jgi:hypothetical protein
MVLHDHPPCRHDAIRGTREALIASAANKSKNTIRTQERQGILRR